MVEIEAKIRVSGHAEVRTLLNSAGAEFVGEYREFNRILDRMKEPLRSRGCGLRVRSVETLKGREIPSTLTYKGAVEPGQLKCREEIETLVGRADTMVSVLERLGFATIVSFEKRRETWQLVDCSVELDEVPLIGTFVEVEGPSEDAVEVVLGRLNLSMTNHVADSYVSLLVKSCDKAGRKTQDIRFD